MTTVTMKLASVRAAFGPWPRADQRLVVALALEQRTAQQGQGQYVTEAAARLSKLIAAANKDGYILQDNNFSIGGGWLKQSQR